MEEYYIEKLLECSRRLPVIKQFLLLLLDYAQLEKYCFRLFDGKWNTMKLYQFVCEKQISIPWSILVTDQYKWNYFVGLLDAYSHGYGAQLSGKDLEAFKYIVGTRYDYDRNVHWYFYKFSQNEKRYVEDMAAWCRVSTALTPYNFSLLQGDIVIVFKYNKLKINCLKALYRYGRLLY